LREQNSYKKLAIEADERFLIIWKEVDLNLPELSDTKVRRHKLRTGN